jgi:hypothetical protein
LEEAEKQNYEEAARLRDQMLKLQGKPVATPQQEGKKRRRKRTQA